jgi:hypothetical protein
LHRVSGAGIEAKAKAGSTPANVTAGRRSEALNHDDHEEIFLRRGAGAEPQDDRCKYAAQGKIHKRRRTIATE